MSEDLKTRNIEKQVREAAEDLERCYARGSGVRAALRRYERAVMTQKIHLEQRQ